MKKSKVIIPALAMIAISAAASVTGSVAWFTAQRTGEFKTSNFAVVKTDGNLGVAVGAGIGTRLPTQSELQNEDADISSISLWNKGSLANASFNPKTKQLWTNANGTENSFTTIGGTSGNNSYTGNEVTSENPLTYHPYVYNANVIYYAYTWTVTLSMNDGAANYSMNVFFDVNSSSMTNTQQAGDESTTGHTGLALRVAIINETSGKTIVYSGLQDVENMLAVTGESAQTAYGTNPLNSGFTYFGKDKRANAGSTAYGYNEEGHVYSKANDSTANQDTREDYLGQLTYASNSLTLRCVAWFEGSDPEIVNGNRMEEVQSIIAFYSTSVIS